ncbi:DUF998 domain-containing protein [Dactylosporangium siamense]|uniref:DUF998 domain-containing protein n=1 Tax=Dactylosporangium siamense TaxID=685454 RepID=UPI001EF1C267|nr:DUF998 domain-containing protein [Dactylosporangium siamense]
MGSTPDKTLLLGGSAVVVLVGLHCLPGHGGVNPVHGWLSEYPLRSVEVGAPYALALLSGNLATVRSGIAMARHGLLRGWPAKALLGAWCTSLLALTVFLKDPAGSAGTWYGEVHKLATMANFACLPALCALLWWRFRTAPPWRRNARTVGVLAALHVACAVPFAAAFLVHSNDAGVAGEALGLIERGIVAIDIWTIATLTRWSRAMQDRGDQPAGRAQTARHSWPARRYSLRWWAAKRSPFQRRVETVRWSPSASIRL